MHTGKLTNDTRFQIYEDGSGHISSNRCFLIKGAEEVVRIAGEIVSSQKSIGANTVFDSVQFPASVPNLNSSLANVY